MATHKKFIKATATLPLLFSLLFFLSIQVGCTSQHCFQSHSAKPVRSLFKHNGCALSLPTPIKPCSVVLPAPISPANICEDNSGKVCGKCKGNKPLRGLLARIRNHDQCSSVGTEYGLDVMSCGLCSKRDRCSIRLARKQLRTPHPFDFWDSIGGGNCSDQTSKGSCFISDCLSKCRAKGKRRGSKCRLGRLSLRSRHGAQLTDVIANQVEFVDPGSCETASSCNPGTCDSPPSCGTSSCGTFKEGCGCGGCLSGKKCRRFKRRRDPAFLWSNYCTRKHRFGCQDSGCSGCSSMSFMRYTAYRAPNIRPGIEYVYGPKADEFLEQIVETEAIIIDEEVEGPAAQSADLNPDMVINEPIPERDSATSQRIDDIVQAPATDSDRPVAFSAALSRLLIDKR